MQIASWRNRNRAQASERMRSFLPLARWRERGPGGEGGDRATPSAAKLYKPKSPIKTLENLTTQSAPKKQPLARDTVPGYAGEGSKTLKPSCVRKRANPQKSRTISSSQNHTFPLDPHPRPHAVPVLRYRS
jgi:hypothetical protein